MTRQNLARAIARPAQKQGMGIEPGLVTRILDDVGDELGNLSLLEFALTALWEASTGAQMTHAAYNEIGGVMGALATHADEVYTGLDEMEQAQARHIFTQMVNPGEGTEDTRRLATREELGEKYWPLVQQLVDARLLVTGHDPAGVGTVELAHEALIRSWERLQRWMDEEREFRAWQERLRLMLRQWQTSGRDEGALVRGVLLEQAHQWAANPNVALGVAELAFIEASQAAVERQAREEEESRQRTRRSALLGLAGGAAGFSLAFLITYVSQVQNGLLLSFQLLLRALPGGVAGLLLILLVDMVRSAWAGNGRWARWLLAGLAGAASFAFLLLYHALLRVTLNSGLGVLLLALLQGGMWGFAAGLGRMWMLDGERPVWQTLPLIMVAGGLVLPLANLWGHAFEDASLFSVALAGMVMPLAVLGAAQLSKAGDG